MLKRFKSFTIIEKIRKEVRDDKTKIQVALELGLPYYQVKKYTRGYHTEKRISDFLVKKI